MSIVRVEFPIAREVAVSQLLTDGVVVVANAFSQADAERLAAAAATLEYEEQPEEYGARRVRQQVASVALPEHGVLAEFADTVEYEVVAKLGAEAFGTSLHFNHRNIQRYLDGTLGIEPHQDESKNINLVVLCGLSGSGRFRIYQELGGPVTFQSPILPGSILLMVAPGFCGRNERPVHGVDEIRGTRALVGLRQQVG